MCLALLSVRQTPLSHVNLRSVQDRLPNAFIAEDGSHKSIQPLIGQFAYYQVKTDGFEVRVSTLQEVDAHFADIRLTARQHPKRNLSVEQIRALDKVKFSD